MWSELQIGFKHMYPIDITGLPGHQLVSRGFAALAQGIFDEASFIVLMAAPRLRDLGFHILSWPSPQMTPCLLKFVCTGYLKKNMVIQLTMHTMPYNGR